MKTFTEFLKQKELNKMSRIRETYSKIQEGKNQLNENNLQELSKMLIALYGYKIYNAKAQEMVIAAEKYLNPSAGHRKSYALDRLQSDDRELEEKVKFTVERLLFDNKDNESLIRSIISRVKEDINMFSKEKIREFEKLFKVF